MIPELVLATSVAAESGSEWQRSRRRRNSKTRKCEGASESSGEVGLAVRMRAAKGPACECAAAGGLSSRRMERLQNSSMARDAGRCHHGWCRAGVLHPHRQGAEQGSATARGRRGKPRRHFFWSRRTPLKSVDECARKSRIPEAMTGSTSAQEDQ